MLQSLTLSYNPQEDRILAATNLGRPDAWSCWLTRRLVLAMLDQTPAYLSQTSSLTGKTPVDYRSDLIAFEREAALAQTASAMSHTDDQVVRQGAERAELADRVTLHDLGGGFRVELYGVQGGGAAGDMARAEFQRILQMLADEAGRAGWLGVPTPIVPAGPGKSAAN